jgi:hypothetical protein
VLAPRTDLVAPTNWIPCCLGPFDFGMIAHAIELNTLAHGQRSLKRRLVVQHILRTHFIMEANK